MHAIKGHTRARDAVASWALKTDAVVSKTQYLHQSWQLPWIHGQHLLKQEAAISSNEPQSLFFSKA
jgi:hypothetical protein